MNRNRDTGTPLPPDLNYTLAHFFTEAQSQKIESDAAEMVALSGQLLDSLIKFGKQAEAWLVAHPLEAKARTVLLGPLKQDGVQLATLLNRVMTRTAMVAPARTREQLEASLHLQLQDIEAGLRQSSSEQGAAALKEAQQMAACAYAAITASNTAIAFALNAMQYRKEHHGHLTADEMSAGECMRLARKKNDPALASIQAWRYAQAQRESQED